VRKKKVIDKWASVGCKFARRSIFRKGDRIPGQSHRDPPASRSGRTRDRATPFYRRFRLAPAAPPCLAAPASLPRSPHPFASFPLPRRSLPRRSRAERQGSNRRRRRLKSLTTGPAINCCRATFSNTQNCLRILLPSPPSLIPSSRIALGLVSDSDSTPTPTPANGTPSHLSPCIKGRDGFTGL
jgi:hypothetical protein